ncbi:dihydrofolate reductase family protein [Spirosoma fluviale]|uniref:Dihydrofolate reductase n=1 Tax=Spirosoma fluviale TaxID=1597977 RepID=A0A286GGV3_9BACT|nr:dihydrofolate reductase family protein [Spirosoma fluviale]SOD94753.1 Dihydrofolate reductase [Spirosoma fluviale]
MRKLILYIATSLDGYIARADGRVDWLESVPNPDQLDYGYADFLATIDTTLMGNATYQTILGFGGDFPYPDKTNYVFSRQRGQADTAFIRYVEEDPATFTAHLKNQPGKDIWLVGGGQLNTVLLNAGLIDQFIITLAPVSLGAGIPLFGPDAVETPFKLIKSESFETGFVQVVYEKVPPPTPS